MERHRFRSVTWAFDRKDLWTFCPSNVDRTQYIFGYVIMTVNALRITIEVRFKVSRVASYVGSAKCDDINYGSQYYDPADIAHVKFGATRATDCLPT